MPGALLPEPLMVTVARPGEPTVALLALASAMLKLRVPTNGVALLMATVKVLGRGRRCSR